MLFPCILTKFVFYFQAVHLKPDDSDSDQLPNMLREKLGIDSVNISGSSVGPQPEEFDGSINVDDQDSDDSNITAGGPAGLKNLSSDSTAVPRIKILKVVPMENVNQDYIINIFDQISEEDDDPDVENESSQDLGNGDNNEGSETVSAEENGDESGDENDIEALISIDFVSENNNNYASHSSAEAFERMPARLEKADRFSFSFFTERYNKKLDVGKTQQTSKETIGLHASQQEDDGFVHLDRVKLGGSNKKLSVKYFIDIVLCISF